MAEPSKTAVAVPENCVVAKVTKIGAGRIATGVPGEGIVLNTYYARGAEFVCPIETAALFEARGWVEVD